jgi:hypothetical protein
VSPRCCAAGGAHSRLPEGPLIDRFARALLVFIVVGLLIGLGALGLATWRGARAVRRFRAVWGTRGKDLLLVYSNSPHWQHYVETHWLRRWGERAVVLNWSERARWLTADVPEARLFRVVGGAREFNPLAVVVPAAGPIKVVRFWRAFRDYKHGRDAALRAAEAALDEALGPAPPGADA